jgi:hypothetical protein
MGKLLQFLGQYKKEVILGVIIFLVATTSFALGYLANRELNHAPIIIERSANSSSTNGQ